MEKNAKRLLGEHCQREKIPHPLYECKPDKEGQPNGFFCTLKIGDKCFTIPEYEKSKKAAEMSVANMACRQMNITHSSVETKNVKPTEKIAPVGTRNTAVKVVKDPDWVTIENVGDIYKYLTDEVLAQEFKGFLHGKAQDENKGQPVFTVSEVEDSFYIATVVYDGVTYGSLGPMVTKKQAEQSAAEVCLRTLGDFPNVTKDKFTIQQYRGGTVMTPGKEPRNNVPQKQRNGGRVMTPGKEPRNNVPQKQCPLFRLLFQCILNLRLQHPILMHKVDSSGEIPLYTVALQFEGKIFKSTTPATTILTGVEEASVEALKYLGVADPEEASTLRQGVEIPDRCDFSLMTFFASPLVFSPSNLRVWVSRHLELVDEMTGKEFVMEDDKKSIIRIRGSSTQDANEIFERTMKMEPRLNGTLLSECGDIVVAEVNNSNKSNTIVGNQDFSIQMFAENGKILSTKKGSLVDLSPGQNIRGLKCSYQLMYPSLQVYLKAESCTEVTKPRKPLPVVTSCGVAMLIYDHEAHIKDFNILLTRPSEKLTFTSISNYFRSYLKRAITSANTSSNFTVTKCVENITTWTEREVQLMSEMTVQSMKELLSVYVRYSERWNELFGEKQTDVLKELKEAALAELSRRKTAGVVDVEEEEEWRLPMTAFQHTLSNSGVYMEDTVRCAFRSAALITGTKVKLGDLEESKIVDVPVNSANKGAVCRYYVWKGIRKVSGDEPDPYYKVPTDVPTELGDGWVVTSKSEYPAKSRDMKRFHNRHLSQKRRRCDDNDADSGVSEPKKGNTELDEDITDIVKPADEEAKVPMEPGVTSFKPISMECRWVSLEEAKKICPILRTIANETPFKDQVAALQQDANDFLKEKQVKQEGV